jgi:SAM-dependent methyltransferase
VAASGSQEGAITSRAFWRDYWQTKGPLSTVIPERFPLTEILDDVLQRHRVKSSIELGGFPGHYALWLRKYRSVAAELLDFVIDHPQLEALLAANGLPVDAIPTIEADLFKHTPTKRYDLVYSLGLIEHFTDTRAVIEKHLAYLADDGVLLIEIPNFRGLNGLVQKTFDRDIYDGHNIACMDPQFLRKTCEDLGLVVERADYHVRFGVWLEAADEKPRWLRWAVSSVSLAGQAAFKLIPFKTAQFSPYIVLVARRK